MARGGYGQKRYEKLETQRRIRAVYEDEFVAREERGGAWKVVDGGGGKSAKEIGDEVWNVVAPVLADVNSRRCLSISRCARSGSSRAE